MGQSLCFSFCCLFVGPACVCVRKCLRSYTRVCITPASPVSWRICRVYVWVLCLDWVVIVFQTCGKFTAEWFTPTSICCLPLQPPRGLINNRTTDPPGTDRIWPDLTTPPKINQRPQGGSKTTTRAHCKYYLSRHCCVHSARNIYIIRTAFPVPLLLLWGISVTESVALLPSTVFILPPHPNANPIQTSASSGTQCILLTATIPITLSSYLPSSLPSNKTKRRRRQPRGSRILICLACLMKDFLQ